jgi:hypothetical protein
MFKRTSKEIVVENLIALKLIKIIIAHINFKILKIRKLYHLIVILMIKEI